MAEVRGEVRAVMKVAARVAVRAVGEIVVGVGGGMAGMEIGGLVRCRPRYVRRARWTTRCGVLHLRKRAAWPL